MVIIDIYLYKKNIYTFSEYLVGFIMKRSLMIMMCVVTTKVLNIRNTNNSLYTDIFIKNSV